MVSKLYRVFSMSDVERIRKMGTVKTSGLTKAFRKNGPGHYYHRGNGEWTRYSAGLDAKRRHKVQRDLKTYWGKRVCLSAHSIKYC